MFLRFFAVMLGAFLTVLLCRCHDIPSVEPLPETAYPIRLAHLDVARHAFSVSEIKTLIAEMHRLRFNTLHLHLADNQGWRFPVPAYPRLSEVAASRVEPDGTLYRRIFSADELREIVDYATARGITVIPEVDVPGHSRALLAAYPECSCSGKAQTVGNNHFDPADEACSTLCVSNPRTLNLMKAVIDELCLIFPGPYIHLGGDECDFSPWKQCPRCQTFLTAHNLPSERELQGYFMNELGAYLAEKGKRMVVWDEYTEVTASHCTSRPLVMVWQNSSRLDAVLAKGFEVIFTPANYFYLDYAQGVPGAEPFGDHLQTLSHVYSAPAPSDSAVLGLGCCLWTEAIPDADAMQYMYFPRLNAVSEIALYRDHRRPWNQFRAELPAAIADYRARGINASCSGFQVKPRAKADTFKTTVVLESELPFADSAVISDLTRKKMFEAPLNTPFVMPHGCYEVVPKMDEYKQKPVQFKVYRHQGIGRLNPARSTQPAPQYSGQNGASTLADGLGTASGTYRHFLQVGFAGAEALTFTFEFPEMREIERVELAAIRDHRSWITAPESVSIRCDDAESPHVLTQTQTAPSDRTLCVFVSEKKQRGKRFTVTVVPGKLPPGHYAEGKRGWTFLSEIQLH